MSSCLTEFNEEIFRKDDERVIQINTNYYNKKTRTYAYYNMYEFFSLKI